MKVLHVITQKPNSTGSGVYLSGMVTGFSKLGYQQAVVAGIDIADEKTLFDSEVAFYPVLFNQEPLNFDVVGMSDAMPYCSTRYRDLSLEQVEALKMAFKSKIEQAIQEIKPDVIICHHLYLLTAFVRELVQDIKVVAVCHDTCLRQLKTIPLEKEYIKKWIGELDLIFALHQVQKQDIIKTFDLEENKVVVIGSGYNDKIFYNKQNVLNKDKIKISYAGKVCEYKGLKSLIRALNQLSYPTELIEVNIAGIGSNITEYNEIVDLAKNCQYQVNFVGKLNQEALADLFNQSQLFVLPSFYEGLPLVILEALACNCNIVTTDILGVKEWLGNKVNDSHKIEYVKLPTMIAQGVPDPLELPDFEKQLTEALTKSITQIIKNDKQPGVDMSNKTFMALSMRMAEVVKGMLW